jgi:inosine-uridine nucleoside N-ribohydrolase
MRKIILDVDTGTDDAVAIAMAATSPDFDLIGCTTVWGNSDVEVTTENTLRVLAASLRDDVPVHRGLGKPFAPDPFAGAHASGRSHGTYGVLDLAPASTPVSPLSAVEWLVETLRQTTEPITLVPVGPLSNIAAALTVDPTVVEAVEEVVIMGGGHAQSNMTASAEANIWHDPAAASVVFEAGFRRIVLIPLDATNSTSVTMHDAEQLMALGTGAATLAAKMIDLRVNGSYAQMNPLAHGGAPLNDAVCLAYLLDPLVLETLHCNIDVERTSLLTYGRTVVDTRQGPRALPPNAHIALRADRDRFLSALGAALSGTSVIGRS